MAEGRAYHVAPPGGAALLIAAALAAGVAALVFFFPRFLDFVVSSGNAVIAYPGDNLLLDYALGAGWALVLALAILVWPRLGSDRRPLLLCWGAKCLTALGLALLFERQYGLDGDGYFVNANSPGFVWEGFRLGHGTENMWHLTWLHLCLVPHSYHAAKVGCAMLGLIAIYQFYKTFEIVTRRRDARLLFVLAFWPSILFWSSTLGKEAPTLLGIALYARGVVAWLREKRLKSLGLVLIGCVIVAFVRFWYVPIMLGPFLIADLMAAPRSVLRWPVAIGAAIALAVSVRVFQANWGISGYDDLLEQRSAATNAFLGGGSTVEVKEITGISGIVRDAPEAAFMALFRPLPLEVPNAFGFVQGLENLLLLLLFLRAVCRTKIRELFEPMVVWAVLFISSWAVVYGLVTYNFGTLVRYKLQILPVFLGLLFYLGRSRKTAPVEERRSCAA